MKKISSVLAMVLAVTSMGVLASDKEASPAPPAPVVQLDVDVPEAPPAPESSESGWSIDAAISGLKSFCQNHMFCDKDSSEDELEPYEEPTPTSTDS